MMRKTLLLVGSGEYTDSMNEVDKHVLSLISAPNPKTALIPTAAAQEKDYKKWIQNGVIHFKKLNYQAFGIDIAKKEDAQNPEVYKDLQKASLIYFSGGDPGYLLTTLKGTKFMQKVLELYESGVIVVASSAGAMFLGNPVLSNVYKLMEGETTPLWKEGIGLVNRPVLPHYDYAMAQQKDVVGRVLQNSPRDIRDNLLGIDEDTALLVQTNSPAKVLGKGKIHIYSNNGVVSFNAGKQVKLA